MVSWMICRLVVLVFGMLYPAYASYKAVKTKNIREYVRWMMYWIVFALFMTIETFTDIFISWFPFYYEIKMAFVVWLLSPYTKGASLLYRKFVHPALARREKEIDSYIVQAKERSYETVLSFGKRGLNIAASAAVQAAAKSQGALAGRLRSFSMQDLRTIPSDPIPAYRDPLYLEDQEPDPRPPIGRRAVRRVGAGGRPWPEWSGPRLLTSGPGVSGAAGSPCSGLSETEASSRGREGPGLPSYGPPVRTGKQGVPLPAVDGPFFPLPLSGYHARGSRFGPDSDSEEECWSDSEVSSQPPPRPREKPLARSQSLRVGKKKPPLRETTSRSLKSRTRKKVVPSELDN
uniref:Receptor expression-enhancing protein n=1 Tax=Ornithorhynchus anatinus TaxID=9258 RepID=A0A6I8MXU2_ORNAN